MSISTPQGGGSRRPSATKAVAGGKPNLSKDADEGKETPAKATGRSTKAGGAKAAGTKAAGAKAADTAKKAPAKAAAGTARKAAAEKAEKKAAPAKKASGARFAAGAESARPPGGRSPGRGGKKPFAPVRVSQGRNWGPIALFTIVILVAVGIIGFAGWKVYETGLTVNDRVNRIDGAVNFREKDKNLVKPAQHQAGPIKYTQTPPVAGKHNNDWQNCMGDVYDAPIANEHAVHSLEHGAVWLTYNPAKVSKEQIDKLAGKIRGKEYSLMSPVEGLEKAVSVQAWGFQFQTNNPNDKRIDEFIKATRKTAAVEPGVACSGGITETGTTPRDLPQQQQPGQPPAQPGG